MASQARQRVGGASSGAAGALGAKAAEPTKSAARGWKSRFIVVHLTGDEHFDFVLTWAMSLVVVCLCAELSGSTAYGRFGEGAFVSLNPRLGWWLMELPVTITFLYFFFVKGGPQSHQLVPRLFALHMAWHYAYRGWLFPYSIRAHSESKFSLVPALFGSLVTVTHGYLNAKWYAVHGKHLTPRWLKDPRFLVGLALYASGFAMIVWHDNILRDLRKPGGPRYVIPTEGLFQYVTCAQYFAELWAFTGWWLMSYGPNGLFILAVSTVNLVPRAVQTTLWYREKFPGEYPAERKHIIPFLY